MLNDSSRTPLVIDGDLRTITVPMDYVFGVYNDKDVLAVPFVCPRYIDDIDLSELSIRVNFTNSVGTSSYYDVPSSDVTINTDTIEFTWLLGSAVFTGSGEVTFAVCLRKIEANGLIVREFNTTLASAKVLEGLEVENQNDPAQYSILTALQSIADSVNSSIESADEYAEQLKNYVGSPLVANTSTDMVDVSRVYVYTGNETGYSNGHWYYYNNAAWHDGGNYNAVANGIYPDLTAGNVLLGRTQSDSAPYLLRKTGNRLNKVGYSCYETIVGASVGWNQLCPDSEAHVQSSTALSWNTFNLAFFSLISGHKYFVGLVGKTVSGGSIGLRDTTAGIVYRPNPMAYSFLYSATTNTNGTTFVQGNWDAGTTDAYLMWTDLTVEFGTTIADYVYSLESSTAGSGIAKLREWGFCTGYKAYNAGSIESVEVTDKVVRGFNQWDEEWEVGGYNSSTGEAVALTDRIRGKNYIPVIPSATYYFAIPSSTSGNVFFYDANKAFLSSQFLYAGTFSVPSNAYYLHIAMQPTYGTTYNNDICISISSDRNGEYEPYKSASYPLGNDTLRGIFKLDASNNLYANGDTKSADGTITRRYGVITPTSSSQGIYARQNGDAILRLDNTDAKPSSSLTALPNVICDKLVTLTPNQQYSDTGSSVSAHANGYTVICIAGMTTKDEVIAWLQENTPTIVYELATPTTEQSTPFTSPQVCYPDGTEEFITTNSVPVGHETNYPYDMKSISEELLDIPDVPSTNGTYVLKATRSASGLTYTWVTG